MWDRILLKSFEATVVVKPSKSDHISYKFTLKMVQNTTGDFVINIETRLDCPNCSEELKTISTIQLKPSTHSNCQSNEETIIQVPQSQDEPSEVQNEPSEEPIEPSKKRSVFWWCRLLCLLTMLQFYLVLLGAVIFGIIWGGFWRYISIFVLIAFILVPCCDDRTGSFYCALGSWAQEYWKAENKIEKFKAEF